MLWALPRRTRSSRPKTRGAVRASSSSSIQGLESAASAVVKELHGRIEAKKEGETLGSFKLCLQCGAPVLLEGTCPTCEVKTEGQEAENPICKNSGSGSNTSPGGGPRAKKSTFWPKERELTPRSSRRSKIEKSKRLRKKVAQEILSTEREYVNYLNTICKVFLAPLELSAANGNAPIPEEDIKLIFRRIKDIRDLNQSFLEAIEPLITRYDEEVLLGKTLSKFAPFFKMYTLFVNAHQSERVQDYMRQITGSGKYAAKIAEAITLRKRSSTPSSRSRRSSSTGRRRSSIYQQPQPINEWAAFCMGAAKVNKSPNLPSLLIRPVQRVPRYRLLLEAYLKYTDEGHPDYQDLQEALISIQKTADMINKDVENQRQRAKVEEIQTKFGLQGLVAPSRRFRLKGRLMKRNRKQGVFKEYLFFLFSDLLLYGKTVVGIRSRYTLHQLIPINRAFNIVPLPKSENPLSFLIVNSKKSFEVYAKSAAEFQTWMRTLADVMQHRAAAVNNQSDVSFVAPIWESDNKKTCQRQRNKKGLPCGTTFSFFRRRHHCRCCGVLCCSECSPYRVYLTEDASCRVRVCTECVWGMMELDKNQTLYRRSQLPPLRSESPLHQRTSYSPGSSRRRSSFFYSTNGSVLRTDMGRRRRSSIASQAEHIDSMMRGDEDDEDGRNSEMTPQLEKLHGAARRSSSERGRRSSSQQYRVSSGHSYHKNFGKATRNSNSMSCDMSRSSYPFDTDGESSIINDTGLKESFDEGDVDDGEEKHNRIGEEEDVSTPQSHDDHADRVHPKEEEEEEKSTNRKMAQTQGWEKEISRNIRRNDEGQIASECVAETLPNELQKKRQEYNSPPTWITHRSGRTHGRSASAKLFFYTNSTKKSKPFRSPPARINRNQGTAHRWKVRARGTTHSTTESGSRKMKVLEEERGETSRDNRGDEEQYQRTAPRVGESVQESITNNHYKVSIVKRETEENPLNVIEI